MKRLLFVLASLIGVVLMAPGEASAHPLGNFSVNQSVALALHPTGVSGVVVVDFAELPTLSLRSSAPEICSAVAASVALTIDGRGAAWTISSSALERLPGAAGLSTSRATCSLDAAVNLSAGAVVSVVNRYLADRIGWREMTAISSGVAFTGPLSATSVTNGLRSYPADLLSSPLDVRSASLRVTGISEMSSPVPAAPVPSAVGPGWTAGLERWLDSVVGRSRLTPLAGLLAVLLCLVLGAAHAALPGHGKTVMAAYLAGRSGRPRDALAVGATVTLTHTGGVLILGLLLTGVAGLAGERVLGWLGVASGVLIAVVGGVLLGRTVLGRRTHSHHHHPHPHGHDHHHDGRDRLGMIGLGVAGGLVPSPTALLVLLGAVGFGRTAFGVLLVLAYGVGMAATLTAAGLLLVRVRGRWLDRPALARLRALMPTATAALIVVVGLGMTGHGLLMLPGLR